MRSNVFQVLVANAETTILAAGGTVDSLANNQLGFFNADTNLSFLPAAGDLPRAFYIAINNGGVITYSAGQEIQSKYIYEVTKAVFSEGVSETYQITIPGELPCETDFAVKIELFSQVIRQRIGTVQFTETFSGRTQLCTDCTDDCPTTGNGVVAKAIISSMVQSNLDLTVTVGGVVLTEQNLETELAKITDANATDIVITVALPTYDTTPSSSVNNTYKGQRVVTGNVSLIDGFSGYALGTVTKTVDAVASSGLGYDIKQKEYFAGGWNGRPGPYRVLQTTNLAMGGFVYNAVDANEYDVFSLTYDQFSTSGWLEYLNNLQTTIAVLTGGALSTALTTQLTAVATKSNGIFIDTVTVPVPPVGP